MTQTAAEPIEDAKATRPPIDGTRSAPAPVRRPTAARSPAHAAVARLQSSVGNRAVAASLQRSKAAKSNATARSSGPGGSAGGTSAIALDGLPLAGGPVPEVVDLVGPGRAGPVAAPGVASPPPLVLTQRSVQASTARRAPALVLQRDTIPGLPVLQRAGGESSWVMDQVADVARGIPGYQLLCQIAGHDLVTGHLVTTNRQGFVEALLTYGPFGPAVGPVLRSMEIVDQIFTIVGGALEQHNLTWARMERDLEHVWDQISITKGIDANVAIVRRALDGILRDVRAMVSSLVERVLTAVREAVVKVAEPLLMTPQIKPYWELAKKVMKYDPLRGVAVQAQTVEILGDFLRLIHREDVLAQMTERGTLQQTADWLDTQFATFSGLVGELISLFKDAWAAIQPQNLPNLLTTLPGLAQRAFGLVQRVGQFASTVVSKVLDLIKKSLLGWLSEHAHKAPGFHLLTVILGRNPFTGDPVERNAKNLIRGFITLIPGGEAAYEQLEESGVIGQAAARIEGEMERLGISWEMITGTFKAIWESLSFEDLLNPIGAFIRIVNQFRAPLGRLVEFAGTVVQVVIELVLKLMNFPSDLLASILAKIKQAADAIQRDPVGFLKNMLNALKRGFLGFLDNIGTHLLKGLAAWLFRGLKGIGVTIPTDLSFKSILTMVMEVLGLSVEKLWQRLALQIGDKKVAKIRGAIDKLTGAWEFIKKVQANGIAAVWEYVQDQLSNLWDTILSMAKDWIIEKVVQRVTAKLISMLDPTGVMAVVNSVIAFFNAVQSAIEYLREILEVVDQWVTTMVEIAAGNIAPAAQKLEGALARAVPIAIGFLANQVGLGNAPEKVVEIIKKVRGLVDKGLDWLIKKALSLGRAALDALRGKGKKDKPGTGDPAHDQAVQKALAAIPATEKQFLQQGKLSHDNAVKVAATIRAAHPVLTKMQVVDRGAHWGYEWAASPGDTQEGAAEKAEGTLGHAREGGQPSGAILPGQTGGYDSLAGKQDPRKAQHAALSVYREHVLARTVVDTLARRLAGVGAPRAEAIYRNIDTILMYEGAKAAKDATDPNPAALEPQMAAAEQKVQDRPNRSARLYALKDAFLAIVEDVRKASVSATWGAITGENSTGGAARGTGTDIRPTNDQVESSSRRQIPLIREYLSSEVVEFALSNRDDKRDDPNTVLAAHIGQEVASRYGGSPPDTARPDYRARVGLGRRGDESRGDALLTFGRDNPNANYNRWTLTLSERQVLKAESKGKAYNGTISSGAVAEICAVVDAVRAGQHDGEGEAPAGGAYPDATRQAAVAKFAAVRPSADSAADAARQVLADGSVKATFPSGRTPDDSTIIRWARDAGVAT